jgi:hypothetical protein
MGATVRMCIGSSSRLQSVGLASRVGVSAEVSCGGAGLREVAAEDGLEERVEDDLSAAAGFVSFFGNLHCGVCGNIRGRGESHPKDQDELEGVVEREPVDGVYGALKDTGRGVSTAVARSELLARENPTYVKKA